MPSYWLIDETRIFMRHNLEQLFVNVNWPGVVVGAVLAFLAGWMWYSPLLFGKGWAADMGLELGTASDMPVGAMVVQGFGLLLLSLLADRLAALPSVFALAIVAVIVFNFSNFMFSKRGIAADLTDSGYMAVIGLTLGLVHALL